MPAIGPQPRPWWRRGAVRLAFASVGVPLVFTALVLTATPADIPASSEIPVLPEGLHVVRETASCGSGGCYREVAIAGPLGASPGQIVDALQRPSETCGNAGLLDFKRRCVGIELIGDEVRLYVSVSNRW